MVQLFFRVYRLAWEKKVWLLHLEIRFVPTSDDMAKLANHGSLCHHLPLFLSCADIYCHLYYHGLYSIIVLYHHLPSSTHDGYSSCSVNFGNISVDDLQNTHVAKTFTHNVRHECSDSSGGKPIFTHACSVLQVKSKI